MKILVMAATPNELKAIKIGIKSADLKESLNIDYLCSGIGNYETISSLEHYLTQNSEPTFIWNIGICGYWNSKNEKKSEPIQVANVINIHTGKEMIIPPFLQIAPLGNCFSSENIILEKPEFNKEISATNNECYFDMESRGIEFIASRYKYPGLILKVPFDFIGQNKSVKERDYKQILIDVDELLKNLPYQTYLQSVLNWIKNNESKKPLR